MSLKRVDTETSTSCLIFLLERNKKNGRKSHQRQVTTEGAKLRTSRWIEVARADFAGLLSALSTTANYIAKCFSVLFLWCAQAQNFLTDSLTQPFALMYS
jgi:hypothetical protein